jgi:hypothetical protein
MVNYAVFHFASITYPEALLTPLHRDLTQTLHLAFNQFRSMPLIYVNCENARRESEFNLILIARTLMECFDDVECVIINELRRIKLSFSI